MSGTEVAVRLTGLTVRIGQATILDGVDLELPQGTSLGIVGQSGSGKSMTAKALAGLLPPGAVATGEYLLQGEPVDLAGSERAWHKVRGARVVWLPQDPFTSLDPLRRVGSQVVAALPDRRRLGRTAQRAQALRRLDEVGLPLRVAVAYPHELSGGMRQRVAIAAALAPDPRILIADEPTTALDVTTQAGILDLLGRLRAERGMSMVLITHDLFLARERCDRLAVFHAGRVVESGPTEQVVTHAAHDVTRELVRIGLSGREQRPETAVGAPLLVARGITKTYPGAAHPALSEASIEVANGEIVGIVGESGSGKTTLTRCLLGLETLDKGHFGYLDDAGVAQPWSPRQAQLVFQNPYASLNPSMSVRATLAEALRSAGRSPRLVPELLELVGLDPALAARRPARLSGGERQRVAIARALAPQPRVLFCDEAVSALDAPVQARILATLASLRERLGLAIVFVTHDLTVVDQLAQRVYVIHDGRIVESGPTAQVLGHPEHPYTRTLLASVPGGAGHRPTRTSPTIPDQPKETPHG
jgi:peptide/nickel transport system ATP-binding protein